MLRGVSCQLWWPEMRERGGGEGVRPPLPTPLNFGWAQQEHPGPGGGEVNTDERRMNRTLCPPNSHPEGLMPT